MDSVNLDCGISGQGISFRIARQRQDKLRPAENKDDIGLSLRALLSGRPYGALTLLGSNLNESNNLVSIFDVQDPRSQEILTSVEEQYTSNTTQIATRGDSYINWLGAFSRIFTQAVGVHGLSHKEDVAENERATTSNSMPRVRVATSPAGHDQSYQLEEVTFRYGEIYRNRMREFDIGLELAVFLRNVILGVTKSITVGRRCHYRIDHQAYVVKPDIGNPLIKYNTNIKVSAINKVLMHTKRHTTCWVSPESQISDEQFSTGAFQVLYGKGLEGSVQGDFLLDKAVTEYIVSRDNDGVYVVVGVKTSVSEAFTSFSDQQSIFKIVGVMRTLPLTQYIIPAERHNGQWTKYTTRPSKNCVDLDVCGSWKPDQEKITMAEVRILSAIGEYKRVSIGCCIHDLMGMRYDKKHKPYCNLLATPAQVFAMALSRLGSTTTITLKFALAEMVSGDRYIGHVDVTHMVDTACTEVAETTVYEVVTMESKNNSVIWGAGFITDQPTKSGSRYDHLCGTLEDQNKKHTAGATCSSLYRAISPFFGKPVWKTLLQRDRMLSVPCEHMCSLACAMATNDRWNIQLSGSVRSGAAMDRTISITKFTTDMIQPAQPRKVIVSGITDALRALKTRAQEVTFSFGVSATSHGIGGAALIGGQIGAGAAGLKYSKLKVLKDTKSLMKLLIERLETSPRLKVNYCAGPMIDEELKSLVSSLIENRLTEGPDSFCDFATYTFSNGHADGTLYCYKWYADRKLLNAVSNSDPNMAECVYLKMVVEDMPAILPFMQTSSGKYCYSRQSNHVIHVAGAGVGDRVLPQLVNAAIHTDIRTPHVAFANYIKNIIGTSYKTPGSTYDPPTTSWTSSIASRFKRSTGMESSTLTQVKNLNSSGLEAMFVDKLELLFTTETRIRQRILTTIPHLLVGVQSRGICPSQVEISIDSRLKCTIEHTTKAGLIADICLKDRPGLPLQNGKYDVMLLESKTTEQNSNLYMIDGKV